MRVSRGLLPSTECLLELGRNPVPTDDSCSTEYVANKVLTSGRILRLMRSSLGGGKMTVGGDIGGTFGVAGGIVNCLDVSVDVLAARVLRRDKNEGITAVHVAWVIKDLSTE
jgi:hypothetical protein